MTWRIWPMLPTRSIPRYLEHMERDHGLRFLGLGWVPFLAKYQRIHPLHARAYDIDYFPEKDPAEIQEYFDMCEASGWEPVLQLQPYKILREEPEGGVPLYWDEDERDAVWRKAARKHLWTLLGVSAICIPILWLCLKLYVALWNEGMNLSFLYYQPRYIQLLVLFGAMSVIWAFLTLLVEWIASLLSWKADPPHAVYTFGFLNTFLVYGVGIALIYSATMSILVEHKSLGSFIGVMIGNGIGYLLRNYFDEDAADRRKLKGIFGPPKLVAILASVILVLYGVGLLGYSFYQNQTANKSLTDPDEPVWVVSENIMCDTVVYDSNHHSYNYCVYELRDSRWIQKDIDRHRSNLMEALVGEDIFHYMTPEQLETGIAEGGSDLNTRRAHAIAAEMLLERDDFDEVLISQIGNRYIVRDGDRIYRLHCSVSFIDDPYLGMEETNVPEIEAKGLEICKELVSQKEELEKMFLN